MQLSKLSNSVDELSHLTRQILSLTKADAGFSVIRRSWVDLEKLTAGLLASYQSLLDQRSLQLSYVRDSNHLVSFMDGEKWQYIIQNLIINAIKFSPAHSTINVSFQRDVEQAIITVSDQGQGIVPDMLPPPFRGF